MNLDTEPAAPPPADLLFSPEPAASPAPATARNAGQEMLDERNADSVLFKLEQLTTPGTSDSSGGSGGMLEQLGKPQANGPQGGSGLIDIKTLMQNPAPDPESDDSLTAETSLAAERSSLVGAHASSTSSMLADSSAVLPATPAKKTPMIVLSVLAGLALLAAVAAVMIRGI